MHSRASLSPVLWGGKSRYGQGWAARTWQCLGIAGKRTLPPAPWVWFHPWPVLALNNCVCVLIGATMLYNAYIISRGEYAVSLLSGHTDTMSLWEAGSVEAVGGPTPPFPSLAPSLDSRLKKGTGRTGQGPLHTSYPPEEEGLAGQNLTFLPLSTLVLSDGADTPLLL